MGVFEPIKAPITALTQLRRQLVALVSARHAAVPLTPAVGWSTPLRAASVEDSDATTGYHQVEMALSQIVSSVGRLNDHRLSGDGRVGEGQLITFAARIRSAERGKSVRQIVIDGNRLVVGTGVRRTTVASALRVFICDGSAVLVAAVDIPTARYIGRPSAAHLAAVPVTGSHT